MINSNARRIAFGFLLAGIGGVLSGCGGEKTDPASSSSSSSSSSSTSSSSGTFIPPTEVEPGGQTLVMAINAGGDEAMLDGIQYQADAYYTGGVAYTGNVDIAGTNEDDVYLSERYENSSYSIPVSNGNYTIHLNFSETYHKNPGERVFNVVIEGKNRLSNVDIFKSVGLNAAMIEQVNNVAVSDGKLDIEFQNVAAHPKITGIVIYKAGAAALTDADKGKKIFDVQCKVCHAPTLKGLGTRPDESGHDIESLTRATDSMPPGAPDSACDAECAYYTAKYIASVNPFFGRSIPGPEAEEPTSPIDAAPPVMSRLSRVEYNNTIRDLFGITSNPANDFPGDTSGTFSNDNAALSISKQHVEAFGKAASKIAKDVVNSAANGNRKAISCDVNQGNCAQTVISELGLKVWRRPLSNQEKSTLKSLYDDVQSTTNNRKTSMAAVVHAMLLSPNFIFRPEFDRNLDSDQAQSLTAYELASRVSYFLWSSTPDDQLLSKAANGSLTKDSTLRAEVSRMLADDRSESLLDNFAMTWLGYDNFSEHEVDKKQFPQYNSTIESAFLNETRTFLRHILEEGRPIAEILNADYTFLNGPLADFYGVQGVSGNNMRRYNWPSGSNRLGLMGHGSSLTAHSHPDKTSPVKRGAWIMGKLMCDRPPEPPADVIAQFPDIPDGLNPREESELHKLSSDVCSSCHVYVDPIGYGMENFSPIGQWRDEYPNGDTVDPASVLPTGESFSSLVELANILAPKAQVTLCSISYAMTYATGRRVNTLYAQGQPSDYAAVYQIYKNTKNSAHSITDVFTEIVLSPAFRKRRGADSQ